MTAALSPGLSWLVGGAVVGFAVFFYFYVVGSSWLDEADRRLDESGTFTEPAEPQLRIFGGVYDAEARGDFDG